MSCCLGIIHVILAIGMNAHLILTARDINVESGACAFVIPCSYALIMLFCVFVAVTSFCSTRVIGNADFNHVYLSKLKDAFLAFLVVGVFIVLAVFLPSKFCYSHNKFSAWPLIMGVFAIVESIVMVVYLGWMTRQLRMLHNLHRQKVSDSVLVELQENVASQTRDFAEDTKDPLDEVLRYEETEDNSLDASGFY